MKTVFITTSRKKYRAFANSSYFSFLTSLWVRGEKEVIHLRGQVDYPKLLNALENADALVIATPVYIDSLPAFLLKFFMDFEEKLKNKALKVYAVTNCGFYEGSQCEILLDQVKCWCDKTGLSYMGGFATGAGEMLGIIRITNLVISTAISAIVFLLMLIYKKPYHSAFKTLYISVGVSIGLYILWSMGLFIKTYIFGRAISKRKQTKNIFTSLWFCPKFLFEAFANLFWILRALKNRVSIKGIFKKL